MGYQHYSVEDFLADESFQRYCSGTDAAAVQFWNGILQEQPEIEPAFQEAVKWYQLLSAHQGNLEQQTNRLLQRIEEGGEKTGKEHIKLKPIYRKWWAAAAVLLVVCGLWFLVGRDKAKEPSVAIMPKEADLAPGGNKAVLTLADGTRLILDTANNGAITRQGSVTVIKLNGQLAYNKENNSSTTEVFYNTITTPRGGQYQLVLADGSKVWLNAASSLRFPTAFTGNERKVEMTGEAYFEIAHNAAMPFIVEKDGTKITVLGTHFNVMAYGDEPSLKVALLEGSVKVSNDNQAQLLLPGQQAVIASGSSTIVLEKDADLNHAVSWKNGLFDFDNDPLPVVMRQLARWYDAEISYSGAIPEGHYTGAIRRQANLSEVLKMLKLAGGVHFSIEGKRIVVQKEAE